ncbi:mechanosensitive ion channel domain-containing protein [Metallibacterium sp.]|uniref:mechanosensitive ion channel family protein n=1 Tax=Metallibacterium sp. TaxID=2940281 RepID=UPI002638018F|nr:mechanosensitive ion channel domain-containing protein [Metallibacterium sp.]
MSHTASMQTLLQTLQARLADGLDFRLITLGRNGYSLSVGMLLGALLILLISKLASWLVQRGLAGYGARYTHANPAALYTLGRLSHYAILVLGVVLALGAAGIPVSKLTLIAGGIGIGLGFGLQAIFNNFISGLILLFDRSLKVGDFVELASGVHGTVRDIKIRATRITTNDDIDILVPNSEFVSGRLINWTLQEVTRRLRVPFGVAYGSSKELVKKAALEAAAAVPFTQSLQGAHAPQVWLVGFGGSTLNFELVVWLDADATRRPSSALAAYNWALETALVGHGLELSWPQRDLRMRSWFGLEGEQARAAIAELLGVVPAASPAPVAPTPTPGAAYAGNDAIRDVPRYADASPSNTPPPAR